MESEAVHHAVGPGLRELFALINLLIVLAIIYFGARKGIMAAIRGRSEHISKKLIDAQTELERIQFEAGRARQEISEIEKTKQKLVAEIREQGLKTYEAMIQDAKATAQRIIADARSATENEVRSASARLKAEVVSRALEETVKLTTGSGAQDLRQRLHDSMLKKFTTENASLTGGSTKSNA
jgi:F0F1-type ATP synthase membrane subunit b/b'